MKLPQTKKSLGQHYLQDSSVINKIINDFADDRSTAIIEVGPGPAILTAPLKELCPHKPFFVIEKDLRFHEYLVQIFGHEKSIVMQDALEVDLPELIKEQHFPDHNIWLVSNLPYNISVPLYLRFLQVPAIRYLTLMVQKEVGDKILGTHTKKEKAMNPLMAITELYFDAKRLCLVPPGAFVPPPEVDSMVISFERKENPLLALSSFRDFEKILRPLFQMKRKQLGRVIKSQFKQQVPSDEALQHLCRETGIVSTDRAETLSLNKILALYHFLREQKHG